MVEDEMEMVGRLGEVDPLSVEVLAQAENVLRAAIATAQDSAPMRVDNRPRPLWARRRALVAAAAAAVVVLGGASAYLATVSGSAGAPVNPPKASPTASSHPAPAILAAAKVRLIASTSVALADSGTATETTTNTQNGAIQGAPTTLDVTFSGQNVNYAITSNGSGAEGVQNREVEGQFYVYVKGPDLQMHWYHETQAGAGAGTSFPDPRTLLQAVSPSAGLENLGQETVGGVTLTHLRATTPAGIGRLGIPDITGTATSFDVWVDGDNVVRQMTVSSASTATLCQVTGPNTGLPASSPAAPLESGSVPSTGNVQSTNPDAECSPSTLGTTLSIQFANLGAPESVTAPSGAIDQQAEG